MNDFDISDMRQFAGEAFIKVVDLSEGPRQETIAAVQSGNYDRPVLLFESGDKLALNATNTRVLVRAYAWQGLDRLRRRTVRRADRISGQADRQCPAAAGDAAEACQRTGAGQIAAGQRNSILSGRLA